MSPLTERQQDILNDYQRMSPEQRRQIIEKLAELTPNAANSSDSYAALPITVLMNMISNYSYIGPDDLQTQMEHMENYVNDWLKPL